uniref:ATP synthase complex subunit 8 n=1 Tax=Ptilodactylidae sp. 2 ACP-2013 TaxID=1434563 RepID=A0A3G5FNN2_9COLE|nr:ATP synthase F0 subunit 8 [Ptilodactylidae sp. 2 ACP-2013]
MPQMAPMSWTILFILFSLIFMLFNLINFYLFNYKNQYTESKNFSKNQFNWKW